MFRKTIPSLSTEVFLELLVEDKRLVLVSWVRAEQTDYDAYAPLAYVGDAEGMTENEVRSLVFRHQIEPHAFPSDAMGVYYKSFPCVRLNAPFVRGEELAPHLAGGYYKAQGYSLFDIEDPSIGSWELEEGAVFTIGVDYEGHPRPCFNAVAYEATTKMHPMRATRQMGAPVSLMIYMPFKGMKLTECSMTFKFNKGLGYSSNVQFENTSEWDYLSHFDEAMPKFEVTSGGGQIPAGEMRTVQLRMVDDAGNTVSKNCTVFLESTGGYLPKNRVNLVNGVGSFKVRALDMEAGDTFKVKAGFRTFTGMLDISFEVI
jgi:hypothetical protein